MTSARPRPLTAAQAQGEVCTGRAAASERVQGRMEGEQGRRVCGWGPRRRPWCIPPTHVSSWRRAHTSC